MHGGVVDGLRVNVERLPGEGLVLKTAEPFERFPGLRELCRQEEISFGAPLRLNLRVRRISRYVEVDGAVDTVVTLACSRCLAAFSQKLAVALEATYSEEPAESEPSGGQGEIELTPEIIDVFPIRSKQIDLAEAIQEQVLLALPVRPLCREDCRGLCATCGADLNRGACGCARKAVDPRFAVLKNLKLDGK